MTKAAKILTVFVAIASMAFMGFAAVNSAVRTDWKTKANAFKEPIAAQKKEIAALDLEIPPVESRLKDAQESSAADSLAMQKRAEELDKQLLDLQAKIAELSEQTVAQAKKAQAVRDEAKLRREEAVALRNQLEELTAQRQDVLRIQKRLVSQLYEARESLERVERRNQLLKSDGASAYEETPTPDAAEPPALPRKNAGADESKKPAPAEVDPPNP